MEFTSVDKEFYAYWEKLGAGQKKSFLNLLKSFFSKEEAFDVQRYNTELEEAEKRIDSGEFISQKDLEKESGTW